MKEVIAILIAAVIMGGGLYFYHYNVYVPKLYEPERIACLTSADTQTSEQVREYERAKCFDNYPHFN